VILLDANVLIYAYDRGSRHNSYMRAWLSPLAPWVPQPTDRHIDVIDRILESTSAHANDIPDVHLAALALEHGLKLYSTDADFAKYADVTWINPLEER